MLYENYMRTPHICKSYTYNSNHSFPDVTIEKLWKKHPLHIAVRQDFTLTDFAM